jgi:hypothetical protein
VKVAADVIHLLQVHYLTLICYNTFVERVFTTDYTYAIYIWQHFLLVRMVRSCVHAIKLPNPINKMTILTIVIIAKFEIVEDLDFRQSAKAPHECCL